MSSFTRRIQRKAARNRADYVSADRPHKTLPCGGYCFLTATKGWRRISGQRLAAQGRLAEFAARCRTSHSIRISDEGQYDHV